MPAFQSEIPAIGELRITVKGYMQAIDKHVLHGFAALSGKVTYGLTKIVAMLS